jgi:3'-phosphoadenosine 5'-phosphosulfate sulfotransferase (PAPS reductase)/FAD synthetase
MSAQQYVLFEQPSDDKDADFIPDLNCYDRIIVAFSGGKDCQAAFLRLLELGVDKSKIELWHHLVDGREGSVLMDWPITEDYCRKFASAFNVPLHFSWRTGGFEREMLRNDTPTASIQFETPSGIIETGGQSNKTGTRLKFPALAASLSVRWCSSYVKVDVAAAAIRNDLRFTNTRTLMITGERRQESAARAKYNNFETHRTDARGGKLARHVDHWRPVIEWKEEDVWAIIQRHGVRPHVAYELGWGRTSCLSCIFGNANQWATIRAYFPEHFERIANYEKMFSYTIRKDISIDDLADKGTPYDIVDPALLELAMSTTYTPAVLVDPDDWLPPAGAYGDSDGPT